VLASRHLLLQHRARRSSTAGANPVSVSVRMRGPPRHTARFLKAEGSPVCGPSFEKGHLLQPTSVSQRVGRSYAGSTERRAPTANGKTSVIFLATTLQRLISDPNCRLNWNSTQTPFKQDAFPGVACPPDAKIGTAGNTPDENRRKPCRGRPFGLQAS
jgi:hypothetical protein